MALENANDREAIIKAIRVNKRTIVEKDTRISQNGKESNKAFMRYSKSNGKRKEIKIKIHHEKAKMKILFGLSSGSRVTVWSMLISYKTAGFPAVLLAREGNFLSLQDHGTGRMGLRR